MSSREQLEEKLSKLPRYDYKDFQPPSWATGPPFAWGHEKRGESSKSAMNGSTPLANGGSHQHEREQSSSGEDGESEELGEGEEVDSRTDAGGDPLNPAEASFSTSELQELVSKASKFKSEGNAAFTAKPPDHEKAINLYKAALDYLPACPKQKTLPQTIPENHASSSGIQEVTNEEADAILEQQMTDHDNNLDDSTRERDEVEGEIRECTKACWGNLGACYVAMDQDKDAVEACTKALEIDPHYVKALQRRASVNDHISTWSSLTSAQDDYTLLLKLLPPSSPIAAASRRALSSLPQRIKLQQEKEKDEMMSKLKELGNGLLGTFGLSTDMFKFEQQDGGGYNLRFER